MHSPGAFPNKGVAIKLDIKKAYDRVEWSFLQAMMLKLRFNAQWTDLVTRCVRTITYQVRMNGSLSAVIHLERGLRQGDPLFAFLFAICTEDLPELLNAEKRAGNLVGMRASHYGINSIEEATRVKVS
ncbi:hypothetical protein V6N11_001975 [Hibiscus sabdariffa]|uniref:Reverse transcriptase domain-containing protein n=1 Tax=Hibiscus sabdariffa TaxID=183260 RepID=A0ABR2QTV7_9ROSI